MTKRQTYGQRMAEWEAEQDKRHWEEAFNSALSKQSYSRLEFLIAEGISSNYDFPIITDQKVLLQNYSYFI